jgi:hypothetical protein
MNGLLPVAFDDPGFLGLLVLQLAALHALRRVCGGRWGILVHLEVLFLLGICDLLDLMFVVGFGGIHTIVEPGDLSWLHAEQCDGPSKLEMSGLTHVRRVWLRKLIYSSHKLQCCE